MKIFELQEGLLEIVCGGQKDTEMQKEQEQQEE